MSDSFHTSPSTLTASKFCRGFTVINILSWWNDDFILQGTLAFEATSSVLASRMVLNLRSTYNELDSRLIWKGGGSSDLVFAARAATDSEPREDYLDNDSYSDSFR